MKLTLRRIFLSNWSSWSSSRSRLHAETKRRLVKNVFGGNFYRFWVTNRTTFLHFYSIFTMKAVAKWRDHNHERESPKNEGKFPWHSKKIIPFHFESPSVAKQHGLFDKLERFWKGQFSMKLLVQSIINNVTLCLARNSKHWRRSAYFRKKISRCFLIVMRNLLRDEVWLPFSKPFTIHLL